MKPETTSGGSRAAVRQYTEELRQQLEAPAVERKRSRRRSAVRWGVGMALVSVVCGIDGWLLFRASDEPIPLPPESVRAVERDNPCAQRQEQVMRAIQRYEGEYGEPPATLALLKQRFPYVEPVDPISEQRFHYTRRRGRIVLACPNPERHQHADDCSANRATCSANRPS